VGVSDRLSRKPRGLSRKWSLSGCDKIPSNGSPENAPWRTCKHRSMFRAISVLLLVGGILSADDIADKKTINAVIGSLFDPQVRSDPNRVGALTTTDFDGDVNSIPVRSVWCETNCESFRVRFLKFVTTDVVLVDGETTAGMVSISKWLMILKRDATGWRISSIRSLVGR
jgi:hypothetical protein